ncbi:MAG: lysylphosphatidylglycerol synthase transmembrane domain-containing protein, partial [Bacteroidota bacterium]
MAAGSGKWKKYALVAVRLVVAVLLMGWILQRADLDVLADSLSQTLPLIFFVALVVNLGRNLLAAYRIKFLLKAKGFSLPVGVLLRDYFIGFFFGFFLPTGIGGDVYRGISLNRLQVDVENAAGSLITERLLGLLSLALLPPAVWYWGRDAFPSDNEWLIWVFTLGLGLATAVLFLPLTGKLAASLRERVGLRFVKGLLGTVLRIHEFRKYPSALAQGFGLSLGYQVLGVLAVYLIGASLDVQISAMYYFLFVPVVWLVSMVPVTINGFGVREETFMVLFALAGMA